MSNSNLDIYRRARTKDALEAFVRARAGRSQSKRREAVERAKSMPNRLSPLARAALIQGAKGE